MYYYRNTCYLCSQAHKRKNYLQFSRWHMLFNTFANTQANIHLWQKSAFILQRSLQRSRSHKKELCALPKFCQKPKEGAKPGLEAGSSWNYHLQWGRIPKGAGFLFVLSQLLYPKTDRKIRQLLPLPTPTLCTPKPDGWPLHISLLHCHTQNSLVGPLAQWRQDSYLETEIQHVSCHLSHLQTQVKAVSYTWENRVKQL